MSKVYIPSKDRIKIKTHIISNIISLWIAVCQKALQDAMGKLLPFYIFTPRMRDDWFSFCRLHCIVGWGVHRLWVKERYDTTHPSEIWLHVLYCLVFVLKDLIWIFQSFGVSIWSQCKGVTSDNLISQTATHLIVMCGTQFMRRPKKSLCHTCCKFWGMYVLVS